MTSTGLKKLNVSKFLRQSDTNHRKQLYTRRNKSFNCLEKQKISFRDLFLSDLCRMTQKRVSRRSVLLDNSWVISIYKPLQNAGESSRLINSTKVRQKLTNWVRIVRFWSGTGPRHSQPVASVWLYQPRPASSRQKPVESQKTHFLSFSDFCKSRTGQF